MDACYLSWNTMKGIKMSLRPLVRIPIKHKTIAGVNAIADGYTIKCAPDIKAVNIKQHNIREET